MDDRTEYVLDLATLAVRPDPSAAPVVQTRSARQEDLNALAELMIEAYRGTIDYSGESLAEAVQEVQAFLTGQRGGKALLEASQLSLVDGQLVAACLVAEWDLRSQPLIAYVMTAAHWKKQGLARRVLLATLSALKNAGHHHVRAIITNGNIASEKLFMAIGFEKI